MNDSSSAATANMGSTASTKYIAALDGLRCFAVLQVMFNHYVIDTRPSEALPIVVASNLFQFLGNGVHLFFVLSGFLITGILLKAKGGPKYFQTFYIRRTLRIFPVYYGVLLVVFGGITLYQFSGYSLAEDASHAFDLQGWLWLYVINISIGIFGQDHDFSFLRFGHFWTLAIEEQFYLIWPLLVLFLNTVWLKRICVTACVVLLASRIYFESQGNTQINFYVLSNDGLFVGSWLAIATRVRSTSPVHARRSAAVFFIAGAIFLALITGKLADRAHVLPAVVGNAIGVLSPALLTCQCVMFAGLLMLALTTSKASILRQVLENRVVVFIGKISYGIYVYNLLLLELFILVADRFLSTFISQPMVLWIATVLVGVLMSILTSIVSWKLLEQPILQFKNRFTYDRRPSITLAPVVAGEG